MTSSSRSPRRQAPSRRLWLCVFCSHAYLPASSRQLHCSPKCHFASIAARFIGVGECWDWPGPRNILNGFGQFIVSVRPRRVLPAHHFAYELFVGRVGDGLILHRCGNPVCFNPKHLVLRTQHEKNLEDLVRLDGSSPAHALTD